MRVLQPTTRRVPCVCVRVMPLVSDSVAQNHNSIGDLVPMHQKLLSQPGVQKFVEVLMQQLLQQDEAAADKKWEVLDSPISDREHLKLNAPAYTCVVQLPGSAGIVGVFKIASNGNCTLFLRMSRAHLDAWCERNAEQKNRKRIFRRVLTLQEASMLIGRAQAFRLQPGQVHHPQALMVICSMALARWIVPPKEDQPIPSRCGSFTLIAVPPTDQNFEQCLTLLGHKSTFTLATSNEDAENSDDEDIEVPLTSLMLSVDVWGSIVQGKNLRSEWAGKFTNATRIFDKCAHPKTLTKCVPSINAHAEGASVALDAMRKLLTLETKGCPFKTMANDAQKKAPSETPQRNSTLSAAEKHPDAIGCASEQKPPPATEPRMLLAPSDMSESEDDVADTTQKKVKAVEAGAAASSSGTAGKSTAGTSRSRAGEKRGRSGCRRSSPRGSDDDDDDEYDDGSSSSGVSSTDSEKESDDDEGDAGDTFASGVATSDDEDEEGQEEEENAKKKKKQEEEEEAPQQQKKQKLETAATRAEEVAAQARIVAAAELAAKDEALCTCMREIAAQSFEDVWAWRDGANGPAMPEESAHQMSQDLGDIQQAKSPVALVAAMSNLVKTLANAHGAHFKGETCEVPTAHEKRLRAACNQAVQFSDATMVRLDKAIQELTEARAMGHEVLKQISAPSAGENPSSSFTA